MKNRLQLTYDVSVEQVLRLSLSEKSQNYFRNIIVKKNKICESFLRLTNNILSCTDTIKGLQVIDNKDSIVISSQEKYFELLDKVFNTQHPLRKSLGITQKRPHAKGIMVQLDVETWKNFINFVSRILLLGAHVTYRESGRP